MAFFSNGKTDSAAPESKPLDGNQAGAIAAASEQVKSKRGGFRAGSGRKTPGGGEPNVATPKAGNQKPNQVEVSEADIEFVKTIAEAGLKILDRVESNVINGIIDSINDPQVSERRAAYLHQREIGSGDYEVVVNAAGAIAAKYAILSKYAPEAALVSWACIHGMAFHGATSDLKKLAKVVAQVKAKGVKTDANSPQAN